MCVPWLKKERSFYFRTLKLPMGVRHGDYTDAERMSKVVQRYRNFITRIISAKLVVMMLAMMMGQATSKMP